MHRKTVTILLRIRARGHFVMSITKTHESHYVGVLDNPRARGERGVDWGYCLLCFRIYSKVTRMLNVLISVCTGLFNN